MKQLIRFIVLEVYFCLIFSYASFCQLSKEDNLFEQISYLDYNSSKPDVEKLKIFYSLKAELEKSNFLSDSAYTLALIKISKYEFLVNQNYQASINYANKALRTTNALKSKSLKLLIVNCYYNLASSYQKLMLYKQALNYYDTVISLCSKNFNDINNFQLDSRVFKADIYRTLGDYQKILDESNEGIHLSLGKKDSLYLCYFLNDRAQAFSYVNSLNKAFNDAVSAKSISKKMNEEYELATAYKTLGFIYEKKNMLDSCKYFLRQSIQSRTSTNYYNQIVNDYVDLGNFYLNNLNDYQNAILCYKQTLSYANKIQYSSERNLKFALGNTCIGETNLIQQKFKQASDFFLLSFSNLQLNLHNNIKENPESKQVSSIANKDLVIVLMNNKTNLLLQQYKYNHDKSFLTACIQSALVTDSVITQIRHEQLGEQSKLYWRDKTRDFYTNAIEACYFDNNSSLAFYFMEKSRAVLLNDKLNELSASAYLSKADAAKQDNYQIKMIEFEQQLSALNDSSKQYQTVQLQLLDVKNDFENFVKSLEQKYPAYYQYKYADDVSTLPQLQSYLKQNNQSFVYYFLGDTVTYILAITPASTKFICLSQKDFGKEQLSKFLQLCADKEMLMSHYDAFASLSNLIYKTIFQPLQLAAGSVIVCSDNIVIPFDALCLDKTGRHFLLNNYSFSYVYSARSLIKAFHNKTNATGNFIGFAPVSFASYLGVQDLKNAADALHASSEYYSSDKLFTYQNATRINFFKYACKYSVVNIFSHAHADTTDNEPVLYMHDSLIHLSELQLLNNPATKLVLLSACQTNVGRNATGEGIYSLARGFATAGIPSVSATLWKADEQTIYAISEKFNQYLAEGMNKDEALQKAKLYFISNNSGNEKLLPYYWANMILIGNTDAIHFTENSSNITWRIIAFGALIILAAYFIYTKRKIKKIRKQ